MPCGFIRRSKPNPARLLAIGLDVLQALEVVKALGLVGLNQLLIASCLTFCYFQLQLQGQHLVHGHVSLLPQRLLKTFNDHVLFVQSFPCSVENHQRIVQ